MRDLLAQQVQILAQVRDGLLGQQVLQATQEQMQPEPPPLFGPGSGIEKWVAYARLVGVEVPPNATREQLIAACVRDRSG